MKDTDYKMHTRRLHTRNQTYLFLSIIFTTIIKMFPQCKHPVIILMIKSSTNSALSLVLMILLEPRLGRMDKLSLIFTHMLTNF